jgi:hypothetical protein
MNKPVGLQGAPDLDQAPRQVVHRLERQKRDGEIEALVAERQALLIPHHDARLRQMGEADDGFEPRVAAQRVRRSRGRCPDIERQAEIP